MGKFYDLDIKDVSFLRELIIRNGYKGLMALKDLLPVGRIQCVRVDLSSKNNDKKSYSRAD